ncbi:MAG: hypothetical protein HUU22_18720 [Phycisphaerae bacterium]|nr:hypothetical protein [Phycisphaerae bacterium]NUQ48051.1 hypothetical protein [Phycisphaerae bacterium]
MKRYPHGVTLVLVLSASMGACQSEIDALIKNCKIPTSQRQARAQEIGAQVRARYLSATQAAFTISVGQSPNLGGESLTIKASMTKDSFTYDTSRNGEPVFSISMKDGEIHERNHRTGREERYPADAPHGAANLRCYDLQHMTYAEVCMFGRKRFNFLQETPLLMGDYVAGFTRGEFVGRIADKDVVVCQFDWKREVYLVRDGIVYARRTQFTGGGERWNLFEYSIPPSGGPAASQAACAD